MILYHIMQREKRKGGKNGKVYMIFADLKAAIMWTKTVGGTEEKRNKGAIDRKNAEDI